ncbi:MAG: alpha/beta fold hydrolase [Candidatus Hydrogenedens sp.]
MVTILFFFILLILFAISFYAYLVWNISNQETLNTNEIYYVRSKDLWEIRLCRFRNNSEKNIPILFVHGFGSNQNNFLLPSEQSIVSYLKSHNFDCWTIDLRGCKSSRPPFGRTHWDASIDDILVFDLPVVIEFILNITGYKKLFWIGHSLGGMLLYAYLIHKGNEKIAGGITLGAPIGFLHTKIYVPSFLVQFQKRFPNIVFLLFRMLIPILKFFKIGNSVFPVNPSNININMTSWDLCKMVEPPPPKMVDEMMSWVNEKKWIMLNGQLNILEHLSELDIPLLLFYASDDPFVNLDTAKEFFNSLRSADKEMFILCTETGCKHNYNHCDLAFGENGEKEVFEPIKVWLDKHEACLYNSPDSNEKSKLNKTLTNRSPMTQEERKTILSGRAYKKQQKIILVKKQR